MLKLKNKRKDKSKEKDELYEVIRHNLDVFDECVARANFLSYVKKATFRVIKEGPNIFVIDEIEWKNGFKEFQGDEYGDVSLLYTIKYRSKKTDKKTAIAEAIAKAQSGGTWHVVQIKKKYFAVEQAYVEKNGSESLFKADFGKSVESYVDALGLSDEEKERIKNSIASG